MSVLKTNPALPIKPFSDVYISTGNGILKNVILRGFTALGGIDKFIKNGQTVFIKPNLTAQMDPATGGTTDVRVCEAVIELIKAHCSPGTIYLGEDNGIVTMETFKRFGYTEMCTRLGVEIVDLYTAKRVDVKVKDAMYAEIISFPKIVLDVDVFITLPILKNHDTVCITAAVKNSFGLVTFDTRRQAHRDNAVEQYLVDITSVRKPDFSIVDGRIGMEGIAGGTYFDRPRFANRIIMGADAVAVDLILLAHAFVSFLEGQSHVKQQIGTALRPVGCLTRRSSAASHHVIEEIIKRHAKAAEATKSAKTGSSGIVTCRT